MSTRWNFDRVCLFVLACTLLLTVLFINGERLGLQRLVDEDAEDYSGPVWFTENDRNGAWDTAGATRIRLRGDSASVTGGGAYFYQGNVIIAQAGRYVLSGSLEGGSVVVSAESSSKVWLLFDGVEIHREDDACLRVDQADKVFLTLAEGSENRLTGGAAYSEAALADGTGGVVYAHDDLTVNGSGSLTVEAAYKHGFDANDDLVVAGGSLTVTAAGDALHVRDSLCIENAALTLTGGDEGIQLTAEDGLFYLASGSVTVEAEGDGVCSAGDAWFEGGALTVRAGDDGVHADGGITVTGGTLLLEKCYEGLEALTIDIRGGELIVYSADDGLNANGETGFGFGAQSGGTVSVEDTWIHISGGSVTVVNRTGRDADGLDSNGDILISGGSVRISLPGDGINSAIDYGSESGGVCEISGGDVVACGGYSMAEGFSEGSAQPSILYNISGGVPAGTEISLEDGQGNILLSWEVPCAFSSVNLSCPGLKLGESCLLVVGEKAERLTLESVAASYGDAESDSFGGPMNWGGMRQRGLLEDGEMPTPPDRVGEGGQMPAPPDWNGEDGQMPAPPDISAMPQGPDVRPAQAQESEAAASTDEALMGPQPVSGQTWRLLAACALALALGIFLGAKYRP